MKSADLQTWFLNKRLRWQQAKWGTGAFLATSTFALAWHSYATGIEGSGIAFGTASLSFLIFATTWNFPRIVQKVYIDWANRYPFDDAKLQDLKDYLNRLANSERSVSDANGTLVDRDILKREWALLFLTSNAKLHAIPSFAGIDTDLASYPGGLFVERPGAISTAVQPMQNIAASAFDPPIEPKLEGTEPFRWPCAFDDREFELRLTAFKEGNLAGVEKIASHLLERYAIVIVGARKHWNENAHFSISKLANELGKLVKVTEGHAGLNGSESVSWIKSVIGGTGDYAFVKMAFDAFQIRSTKPDGDQYRLPIG